VAAQVAEGPRHVLGDREPRALALTGALTNHGSQLVNTMLPILFVRELGLFAGALGLYWRRVASASCSAPASGTAERWASETSPWRPPDSWSR
jgi:hypothetical protein